MGDIKYVSDDTLLNIFRPMLEAGTLSLPPNRPDLESWVLGPDFDINDPYGALDMQIHFGGKVDDSRGTGSLPPYHISPNSSHCLPGLSDCTLRLRDCHPENEVFLALLSDFGQHGFDVEDFLSNMRKLMELYRWKPFDETGVSDLYRRVSADIFTLIFIIYCICAIIFVMSQAHGVEFVHPIDTHGDGKTLSVFEIATALRASHLWRQIKFETFEEQVYHLDTLRSVSRWVSGKK